MLLHGFMDTWRTWELVLPALERRHEVLAPTLPGHAGGPPLPPSVTRDTIVDGVERILDEHGLDTVHLTGNSLGGFVALQLATRGRARSVVALAPAGGWAAVGEAPELLLRQRALHDQLRLLAPHADAIAATPEGRRRATALIAARGEHLPAALVAHLIAGAAACDAEPLITTALGASWELDAAVACPVRIVWGTADELLPWPAAAARFRLERLPQADWVVLDGVGHAPQLDDPLVTAELILGWTAP